jgi:hypothetical protein
MAHRLRAILLARATAASLRGRRSSNCSSQGLAVLLAGLAWRITAIAPTTSSWRSLIEEVITDIDPEAGEIILLVHWVGGVHTELRLPRRRRGQRNSTSHDIIAAVLLLVRIVNDDLIAGILNRDKLNHRPWQSLDAGACTALRSHHKIPAHRPAEDDQTEWLNLTKAAAHRQISAKTLRLAAERGEINGTHPLPDGPWLFNRAVLDSMETQAVVQRSRQHGKDPAGQALEQQSLFPLKGIARWV